MLRLVQQGVLDLWIDPAKPLQVDPGMAGQVDIAQQQIERLQCALHQTLQIFEALDRSDAVIAHAIEHPLQLQQLVWVLVGNQDPQRFVRHRL
ncbi:hypothetical protein D3C85_1597870 [compost metagenome]